MKQRTIFAFCLMVFLSGFVTAQNSTVTNADLERYREARQKAEAEYRRDHAKLGMPSPEELDRRRKSEQAETERLSAELRRDRIERERIDAERQLNESRVLSKLRSIPIANGQGGYQELYYQGYRWWPNTIVRRQYSQPGYFAGGQFWPTGSRTMPRPIWVPSRRKY